jgi:hypothetical protein
MLLCPDVDNDTIDTHRELEQHVSPSAHQETTGAVNESVQSLASQQSQHSNSLLQLQHTPYPTLVGTHLEKPPLEYR